MSFTLSVLRPDDLLNLKVRCVDLRIETDAAGNARLVPSSDADAFLVFIFPPQTITERAYYDAAKSYKAPDPKDGGKYEDAPAGGPPIIGSPDQPGDVPARIGGQSRLVFRLGPTARLTGIELSIEGLLDWSTLELVVTPIADIAEDADATTRANAPPIRPPSLLETAIELPYRLIISPGHRAHWQHAASIVAHGGRVELWHTAIARAADHGLLVLTDAQHPEPLRAIWSPDFSPGNPPGFGVDDPVLRLTAMAPYDRHQIVILTSDFHNYLTEQQLPYVPSPFNAELLMLSPLGGWLKSRGGWAPPYARVPRRIRPDFPWRDIISRIVAGSVRFNDLSVVASPNAGRLLEFFSGVAGGGRGAPVPSAAPDAAPPAPDRSNLALTNLTLGGISGFPSAATAIDVGGVKIMLPELGAQLDLSEWVHVATQGRDHYVRIVYEGRLYPFGHRAALIKITERKFRNFTLPDGTVTPVAYMVQKMFIVVRERVRDFSDAPLLALTDDGRAMPLKRVRLTTTVTPTITYPYAAPPAITGTNGVFWIMVEEATGDADFRFHGIGTDIAGGEIDFTAALVFVPNSRCSELTDLNATRSAYAQSGERRALRTTGQRITLAPREPGSPEETTSVETDALYFETQKPTSSKLTADQVRAQFFTPRMYKARVNIPAAAAIVGARTATTIAYYEDYLASGFAGAGGVFAKVVKEGPLVDGMPTLVGDAIGAAFSAERGGGIATPNMNITSLSRRHGPLAGDVTKAAANTFDPKSFFPKGLPDAGKLFGSFSLEDLIKLPGPQILDKDAPKMRVRTEPAPPAGTRIVADLDWHPNVGDVDAGLVKFIASDHDASAVLDITARIETLVTAVGGNGSRTQINGSLRNFRVEFVNAVWVHVDEFAFASKSSQKPDVRVRLNSTQPVTFVGDLEFVETLRKLIPPGLLGDGPSLDINEERVHAGFSVAIPPASVGVFSLSNIRLGAFVELPFTEGRPIFDFAFALRQDPFTLAVAILGGTGFFHVQLDTDGVRLLEASFEFGAIAALDIGIASGSVHILAGIYFKLEKKAPGGDLEATLSGYMRVGGEMQVLIVRVSVEFILSFTYHDGKATGRATLTVSIEIAFFSVSVELSVERSFGKEGGDPVFDQVLPSPNLWAEYAGAFA
jgi:hypothetical protein